MTDVAHLDANYIACDPRDRSEAVLPCHDCDVVWYAGGTMVKIVDFGLSRLRLRRQSEADTMEVTPLECCVRIC